VVLACVATIHCFKATACAKSAPALAFFFRITRGRGCGGRVAGDIVDVATVATSADQTKPVRLRLASIALLGVGLLDIYSALRARPATHRANPTHDYGNRSGFARPASQMRGAALSWKKDRSRMQAAE
jgi:hypothetical protein